MTFQNLDLHRVTSAGPRTRRRLRFLVIVMVILILGVFGLIVSTSPPSSEPVRILPESSPLNMDYGAPVNDRQPKADPGETEPTITDPEPSPEEREIVASP